MKSYCIALFFTIIALVTAQSSTSPFYITNPLPGTVLKAGDTIDLEWNNGLDQIAKVLLIQGADSGTMSPTDISFEVEGDEGSYTFKIPRTLSPAGTYAFQFEYKNDKGEPQFAYSGPVSVSGGTGTIAAASSTLPVTASVAHATSSVVSSPSSTPSSVAPVVSPSSLATSSKVTAAASTTPLPNAASSCKTAGFVFLPVLLMMAVLYA